MFASKKGFHEVNSSAALRNIIELGTLKDGNLNSNWIQPHSDGRCLLWSKLFYNVTDHKKSKKAVLSNFSGFVRNGEMIAILGSSGSGKTTFLDCATGMTEPHSGSVWVNISDKNALSYVRQNVELHMYLTVKESLLFASRFKNDEPNVNHGKIVERILDLFLLNKCAKTRVIKCSGGEQKRLSIAHELVSNPSLLVLDEPTTGLDSYTTIQCIRLLKSWQATTSSSILLTIHQPSFDTFMEFDRIYVLSNGKCYYDGTPSGVVNYLKEHNIPCPDDHNLADTILNAPSLGSPEVACQSLHTDNNNHILQFKYNNSKPQNPRFTFASFWTHVTRMVLCELRDPPKMLFRFLLYAFFPLLMAVTCKHKTWETSPCFYIFDDDNGLHSREIPEARMHRKADVIGNAGLFLFAAMFIFAGGPTLGSISVGSYFRCNYGELFNKWYSFSAFLTAHISVVLFFAVFYAFVTSCVYLAILSNLFNFSSFHIFLLANFGYCFAGDTLGILVGALFPTSIIYSTSLGELATYFHVFLSDFMVRSDMTINTLQAILPYSPLRLLLQVQMKSIYPLEKCLVDDSKYFNFEQIVDFIKFYNMRTNSTLDFMDDITVRTYDVYTARNWTRSEANELIMLYNHNQTSLELLNKFWDNELNFVYREFGLLENNVTTTVALTTLLCISHLLLAYIIFIIRLKPVTSANR